MKNTVLYIIFILLLFGILFFLNRMTPKEFRWTPTYSKYDKQPFGGYAFDHLLENAWDGNYSHSYKSIERLVREGEIKDKNLLIISNDFYLHQEELNDLISFVSDGHKVMIASPGFPKFLRDTLAFNSTYHFDFYGSILKTQMEKKETLYLCSPSFQGKKYEFPAIISSNVFSKIPGDASVIAVNDSSQAIVIRKPVGKGEFILCCNPILYTNYGILHKDNEFILATLSYLKDKPLMRIEYYGEGTDESPSPVRFIVSNNSLRWALYITLITILLFMIFTAKRKQKSIPVIKDPENRTLRFVRTLAALYLRRNDNTDIARKKYIYFAEQIKRQYAIDIIDEPFNEALFKRIASKTGEPFNEVKFLFTKLKEIYEGAYITDSEALEYIQKMDLFGNKKINKKTT